MAVIGIGVLSTTFRYALSLLELRKDSNTEIWLHLESYLALGLDLQLGADILGTAVSPTFEEVQLSAAIVVIRTVLNYFLVPDPPTWRLLARHWRMPSEQIRPAAGKSSSRKPVYSRSYPYPIGPVLRAIPPVL